MVDFVETLRLAPIINEIGLGLSHDANFETIYSQLRSSREHETIARKLEQHIESYFKALSLPGRATIYDRLLLALRPKDAVFTFNWDPFLFDAYWRNRGTAPLPQIYFLHGNVRIGICPRHHTWGLRGSSCPECGTRWSDVPLLYPVAQKNYSSDPYIHGAWDAAKDLFAEAFTITIFGYSAPNSDVDAVDLLRRAWLGKSDRTFEHIEIIDIAPGECLEERWSDFAPTNHYQIVDSFGRSRLARWPRRSCESLFYPMSEGVPCKAIPIPETDDLDRLHEFTARIAEFEHQGDDHGRDA